STGLPTKTEQSDLYQAVYGRNADSPVPVIAARSPADAFECAIEACRIATRYMTPVMLLTDGYIANAAEPWKVPDMSGYAPFPVKFHTELPPEGEKFQPYQRDAPRQGARNRHSRSGNRAGRGGERSGRRRLGLDLRPDPPGRPPRAAQG